MTSIFDDVRLPVWVENGAQGGPNFSTSLITVGSGVEQRNENWLYPRHSYDIGYGVSQLVQGDATQGLLSLKAFFMARRGRSRAFLFKDWSDYQAIETVIPTGGLTGACSIPLAITYDDGNGSTFIRPITRPRLDQPFTLYVNGTETGYGTVTGGMINFTDLPAGTLTGTFEFDVPVRFDTDQLNVTIDNIISGEVPSIPIMEVIENAYTLNGQTIP